jgi:hypothetical protein
MKTFFWGSLKHLKLLSAILKQKKNRLPEVRSKTQAPF